MFAAGIPVGPQRAPQTVQQRFRGRVVVGDGAAGAYRGTAAGALTEIGIDLDALAPLAAAHGPTVDELARRLFATGQAHADAVTDWNLTINQAANVIGSSPHQSYVAAMSHVAIHDALNSIDRRFATYAVVPAANANASPNAAIAAAARRVLIQQLSFAPPPRVPCIGRQIAPREIALDHDELATLATDRVRPHETRAIVVGIREHAQVGQDVLDLLALEEARASRDLVGDVLRKEGLLDRSGQTVRVSAENAELKFTSNGAKAGASVS